MGSARMSNRLASTTATLNRAANRRKRRASRNTGVYSFCNRVSWSLTAGRVLSRSPRRRNQDASTGTAVSATSVDAASDTQTV